MRPVRRLAEASGRLAEGEADVSVKPEGPRELRELAASFNDMNAKLTKAQETEQAFLLSVSHELKTPLTSVRGYAEGIADGTVKPADGAAVIGAESSRLERLVGDLLDSARMRKSAFTVRREAVDLAALAQDVARRYEGTARDAGLTLHLMTEAGGRGPRRQRPRPPGRVQPRRERDPLHAGARHASRSRTAPGSGRPSADTGRGLTGDDLPAGASSASTSTAATAPTGRSAPGSGWPSSKELTEAMGGDGERVQRRRRWHGVHGGPAAATTAAVRRSRCSRRTMRS